MKHRKRDKARHQLLPTIIRGASLNSPQPTERHKHKNRPSKSHIHKGDSKMSLDRDCASSHLRAHLFMPCRRERERLSHPHTPTWPWAQTQSAGKQPDNSCSHNTHTYKSTHCHADLDKHNIHIIYIDMAFQGWMTMYFFLNKAANSFQLLHTFISNHLYATLYCWQLVFWRITSAWHVSLILQ